MAEKILVTGASGQLGHLVFETLLKRLPAAQLVAGARHTDKAADLATQGVEVRAFDYEKPQTLATALQGIDKLLLISSSELGQRAAQHKNVIDAARQAGIKLLAYTSVLHADRSVLGLAEEHRQTEQAIKDSGIPAVLLRNGWYSENYTASVPSALEHGAFLGSAGDGRIASAARKDYAEAAAVVLTAADGQAGKVYELAGDTAYTLSELATEVGRQAGKPVVYQNLPEADYRQILIDVGLPEPLAELLADSDVGASKGALFDDSGTLGKLIGHPTTTISDSIAVALAA